MDDKGQVEREKHREHQPCWLSVFYMLELKAPVGVGGCTVERKGWMGGAWVCEKRGAEKTYFYCIYSISTSIVFLNLTKKRKRKNLDFSFLNTKNSSL